MIITTIVLVGAVKDLEHAVENRCCDYLQPDSSHAGGITEMKKIAAICDAHHIPSSVRRTA